MTAEQFLKSKEPNTFIVPEEFLIEFAKYHVEQQRKAIIKNVLLEGDEGSIFTGIFIDEQSILDAYPLTNIK